MNRSALGRSSIRIPFIDRSDAGDQLAESLVAYQGRPDVLVLGLPRGGVPVETVDALAREVDEVVCLASPPGFTSVGQWYQDFAPVTDGEVRALLGPS